MAAVPARGAVRTERTEHTDKLAAFVRAVTEVVGPTHVLTDADVLAGFAPDWTGRFTGTPAAVVRPGSTAEVQAVLAAARSHGVALVTQGGNTGLVGGGVALHGEVLLSTRRLAWLAPVDAAAAHVDTGAGTTLDALAAHAAAAGLRFPIDLPARASATLGGMAATNAGGANALRFGSMRHHVVGIEAVLGDGTVLRRMHGLLKDNTGFDLAGLLVGSEGTLGVITALRLALVAPLVDPVTAAFGCASMADAVTLVRRLRDSGIVMEAAEVITAAGAALVGERLGIRVPAVASHPVCVLVRVDPRGAGTDDVAEACARIADDATPGAPRVLDAALVAGATAAAPLWEVRERHTEAIATLGAPVKLDVTLPLARLAAFTDALPAALAGERAVVFGHLGDGNLHVNVLGPIDEDRGAAVEDRVLDLVVAHGGSISAEHGIGTAKARHLHLARSAGERALFVRLRRAFDPDGVLNPHVLTDPADGAVAAHGDGAARA